MKIKAKPEERTPKSFQPVKTLGYRNQTKAYDAQDKALKDAGVYEILNVGMYDNAPSFIGYMALAELSQDGVIKAGVSLRSDEMTRRWIEFNYKGEEGDDIINALEDSIDQFKIIKLFNEASQMCGYYGGCLAYIDVGNISDADLKLPLGADLETFKPNSIKGFKLIEPFYIAPARYNCDNPINKSYFVPQAWYVQGKEIHASRFLYFCENKPPTLLMPSYNFFGVPLAQTVIDSVMGFEQSSKAAARMLGKYACTVFKTDMNDVLSGGSGSEVQKRIQYFATNRDNDGVMTIDKEAEDIVLSQHALGGVTDIVRQQMEIVASMFGEPAVKMWGISPGGFNATGESDMQAHYDHINAVQERIFREPLEYLIKLLQLNMGRPEDANLDFEFISLDDDDVKLQAEINKLKADTMSELFDRGIISGEEIRHVIANDPDSGFDDIDEEEELNLEPLEGEENGGGIETSTATNSNTEGLS